MYTALRKIQPFDACVYLPDDGIVSNLSNQAKQDILFDVQLSLHDTHLGLALSRVREGRGEI